MASEAAADAAVASFAIISVSPGTLVGMIDRGRVSVLSASGFHAVKTLHVSTKNRTNRLGVELFTLYTTHAS